jgi:MoaA/NifB/PqqE/SkfB family radical SAM enzyme
MKIDSRLLQLPHYIWRGIEYHLPEDLYCHYPVLVNFLVTRRCNSRCIMCSIWESGSKEEELSIEEIRRIFSHKVFKNLDYISLAGGEPFLRGDIADIAQTVQSCCRKLNGMSLFTNGFLTSLVEKRMKELLGKVDMARLGEFLVSVSIDGIGPLHDRIRGVEGGFEKANSTIEMLKELQKFYGFKLQLNTVIQKTNLEMLDEVWQFAQEKGLNVHFVPVRLANFVFSNVDRKSTFEIEMGQIEYLKKFIFDTYLNGNESPSRLFWEDYFRVAQGHDRKTPCLWNSYAVALNADGTLFPCEASSSLVYGNVRDTDIEEIWCSKKSIEKRKKLRGAFCKRCTLECTSDGALYREFFQYAGFFMKRKLLG